jgi:hypothetical protein
MYRIYLILLIVFFVSCSKNNQNSTPSRIEAKSDNIIFEKIDAETNIENTASSASENSFPKIMFVNSREGLRIRSEPSINGDINGLLIYGERIVIHEKSENTVDLDGIIDYWYKLNRDRNKTEWVFGGYLSEKLPSDLPIIIGRWDNVKQTRQYVSFLPNHDYSKGRKEAGYYIRGSWEINGNIIRTSSLRPSDDYIWAHGGDPENGIEIEPLKDEYIQLKIINDDNIILVFSENNINFEYSDDKTFELTLKRSEDLW